jgi:lipoprotein-anchoring transpeptidase ErfK/SrfK
MWGLNRSSAPLIAGIAVAALMPVAFVIPALMEEPAPPPKIVESKKIVRPASEEAPPVAIVPQPAPPVVVPPPVAPVGPPVQVPVVIPNPSGPEVLALEQRLSQLGYMVGNVDGVLDGATKHGITAFQKWEGLERNGLADGATLSRIGSAQTPTPRFSTPPDHIEVDIPRQVILMVRGGRVTAVVPTSTGTNKKFTAQGYTRRAVTPNGQFQINFKRAGWRKSPLGMLYRPSYFNGGIALHGSKSVPTSPASHGCVRVPMAFADWFADNAPIGMVVYVYGGPTGENPQPLLDEPPQALAGSGGVPAGTVDVPPPPPVDPAPAPPVYDPLTGLLQGIVPN